jgi:PAS domain S-box-containing protein
VKDRNKAKDQLIKELAELRQQVEKLKRSETERKRAEEKLLESENRFQAIANYTYDWDNWFDPNGKLVWVNPGVFRLTGYTVDECLAMTDFPLSLVREADMEKIRQALEAARKEECANDIEFQIYCKDGSTKWMAISYQPIYDAAGTNLGHRSSIRDITRRKRNQEERERLILELQEAAAKVKP